MSRHARNAVLSAVLFSAVTLFVFWVLQGYGPATALRRFHIAVLSSDPGKLRDLVTSDSSAFTVQRLGQYVVRSARAGAQYQLASQVRSSSRLVVLEVKYLFPDQSAKPRYWVMEREGNRWKVNTDETYALWQRA